MNPFIIKRNSIVSILKFNCASRGSSFGYLVIAYINSAIVAEQAIYNLMENKISLLKITGNIIQDFSN